MKIQHLLIAAGIAASLTLTACGGGSSSSSNSGNNAQKPPANSGNTGGNTGNKPANPPAQPVNKGTCVTKAAGAMSYALPAGESCTLVTSGIGSATPKELNYTCKDGKLIVDQSGIKITVGSGVAQIDGFTLTCKK